MLFKSVFFVCPLLLLIPSLVPLDISAAENNFRLDDGDSIVFLGDSITQAGSKPEGYVSLFQLTCDVNGYIVNVINSGISGHKSNDMLARLDRDVIAHNPDWVSISCGVNDVWHGEKGVPLPDYKKNMTEIVERCQKAGIKVLLLTATPIYEDLQRPENIKLRDYNAFLRELAKEKDLLLCDLFNTFADWYKIKLNDDKLMTTDGVHMNPRGNRLMARDILLKMGMTWREMRQAEKRWELVNNM